MVYVRFTSVRFKPVSDQGRWKNSNYEKYMISVNGVPGCAQTHECCHSIINWNNKYFSVFDDLTDINKFKKKE